MERATAHPLQPEPARIIRVRRETRDTTTLWLEPREGRRGFRPGQFNMLYAFAVGEAAISMSGDPARPECVHTIRSVGAVTDALCRMGTGAVLGVRGPYGRGWPMDEAKGRDLVIVAGGLGLAPLRPVVYRVLTRRADYGEVSLLVGARTPEDLLYRGELARWQRRRDLRVLTTVDRASTEWRSRIGVVPALLGETPLAPDRTTAFVCGPEVMMRFTVRDLLQRGVADGQIVVSLERNMKCAVGLCGRCQYGPDFVCQDGPVLSYERLQSRFWLREV